MSKWKFAIVALSMTFIYQTTYGRESNMPHVTGIGGVFFKSQGDPKTLTAWYEKNLGIKLSPWGGAVFRWSEDPTADRARQPGISMEKTRTSTVQANPRL